MSDIGLFGAIDATARVESLGVKNAYVNGQNYVGIIAGDNYGTIAASWTSGVVRGDIYVGGLVGYNIRTGADRRATSSPATPARPFTPNPKPALSKLTRAAWSEETAARPLRALSPATPPGRSSQSAAEAWAAFSAPTPAEP